MFTLISSFWLNLYLFYLFFVALLTSHLSYIIEAIHDNFNQLALVLEYRNFLYHPIISTLITFVSPSQLKHLMDHRLAPLLELLHPSFCFEALFFYLFYDILLWGWVVDWNLKEMADLSNLSTLISTKGSVHIYCFWALVMMFSSA